MANDIKKNTITTPWAEDKTSMFSPITIDGERWDKLFPYRLLVVKALPNGGYANADGKGSVSSTVSVNSSETRVIFHEIGSKWEYRLPITPQQMSISTPYAISNTATLRGIAEEHNGVKYKIINFSGTFGVWPNRPSVIDKDNLRTPTSTQSLFSGTIAATNNVASQFGSLLSQSTGQSSGISNSTGAYEGTGYAQALLLDQFLEQYAEAKKNPDNFDWRLVLDIPKQNQSFLVTPIQFAYNQSADSPHEIKFSLQLKAFKRADLTQRSTDDTDLLPISSNLLQRTLSTIAQARRVCGASLNLIKAVRSDFQTPLNALRQAALFYKDLAGLTAAAIDLPSQMIGDFKSSISEVLNTLDEANTLFSSASNKAKLNSITQESLSSEGLSSSAVASGQVGSAAAIAQKTSPTNAIFKTPEESFDLFNSISISNLSLTPIQQDAVNTELDLATLQSVDDLRNTRNVVLELATQISNNFGASTELYAKMYNQPTPYRRVQEMTIDEQVILKSLYDAVQAIDITISTQELDDIRIQTAYDFVNDLANQSNMTFQQSQSKILVPVPYGLTIEQIAARYLGDPDRWLEIVTLNALKAPYIDEIGFLKTLLSNASGRQLSIDSNENMFIGQKITIKSNSQPPTQRKITDIEKISDNNYLITVDGLDNLSVYTTSASAKIQAYLSGTINSQTQFFIPSNEVSPSDIRAKSVPIADQDALTGLSKIDWLLDDSGDIALDATGDVRLAFGMTNLIQALKMKFAVTAGQLLKHPKYGNGVEVGSSTADLQLSQLYSQVRETVIADPRFSDINKLEILLNGPTLTFNLLVTIAQNRGILPITFNVRA